MYQAQPSEVPSFPYKEESIEEKRSRRLGNIVGTHWNTRVENRMGALTVSSAFTKAPLSREYSRVLPARFAMTISDELRKRLTRCWTCDHCLHCAAKARHGRLCFLSHNLSALAAKAMNKTAEEEGVGTSRKTQELSPTGPPFPPLLASALPAPPNGCLVVCD